MYKDILTSIESIEIFPIISFIIFFFFFIILLYQVWRSDKKLMKRLAGMPLDADDSGNELSSNIIEKEKTASKHD